jgi:hypothetical protein
MSRRLLGATLAIPFLLASALLVQYEGASYRRSLKRSGPSALRARLIDGAGPPAPEAVVAVAEPDLTPSPAPRPTSPPVEPGPAPSKPEEAKAAPPPPASVASADTPPPKPKFEVEIRPEPKPAPPIEPPKPKPRPPAPPKFPPIPTIDIAKDALELTPEEERRVGRAVHEVILQRHRPMAAPAFQQVLLDAARPLLAQRRRKEVEYQFTILDADGLNTFSHPGGFIYVSRGLFDFVAEEAEWQFLLAHEIAHVDLKHAARQVSLAAAEARQAGKTPMNLVAAFYRQVAVGYTDDQEFEADAWAFQQVIRLGHSRREALMFPRKLLSFVELHSLEGRRPPDSGPEADVQDIEHHWRTAPPALDRLERLQNMAGGR